MFFLSGATQICQPGTGTRPGDPLSDALFNLIMAELLQVLRDRREVCGLRSALHVDLSECGDVAQGEGPLAWDSTFCDYFCAALDRRRFYDLDASGW